MRKTCTHCLGEIGTVFVLGPKTRLCLDCLGYVAGGTSCTIEVAEACLEARKQRDRLLAALKEGACYLANHGWMIHGQSRNVANCAHCALIAEIEGTTK